MAWARNVDDIELPIDDDDENNDYGDDDDDGDHQLRMEEEIKMRAVHDSLCARYSKFKDTNLEVFADLNLVVSQWYMMAEDLSQLFTWFSANNCDDLEHAVEMVSDVLATLLNIAITRVGTLLGSTVRTMDGPGSTFLCVVILVTALDRVLENAKSEVVQKVEASRLPNESNQTTAPQLDPILCKGAAAFDKPISAYTMSELRTAIILMGDEWEQIDIDDLKVTQYLTYLLARACIISNVIQPPEVLDVPRWTVTRVAKSDTEDDDTQLFMANMCFLRFGTAPVCKMLCIIDFWQSVSRQRPVVDSQALLGMRRRIIRKYRELDSVDQTVKLIDDMCQKSRLRYSDVEQFMDENALSRIDAKIVLDTVHNGESQFSMFWFHRKVNGVSFIEEVDEQAEAYPRHATLNQKLFAMNAKLFCFNALLQHELRIRHQGSISFLEKFCYDENDIIRMRQSIDNAEYPLILIIQAMPYVLSDGVLYDCRGMDVAVLVWVECLLDCNNGVINSISYKDALSTLIHFEVPRNIVRKVTDAWTKDFISYY
jgi:hypothetical protein